MKKRTKKVLSFLTLGLTGLLIGCFTSSIMTSQNQIDYLIKENYKNFNNDKNETFDILINNCVEILDKDGKNFGNNVPSDNLKEYTLYFNLQDLPRHGISNKVLEPSTWKENDFYKYFVKSDGSQYTFDEFWNEFIQKMKNGDFYWATDNYGGKGGKIKLSTDGLTPNNFLYPRSLISFLKSNETVDSIITNSNNTSTEAITTWKGYLVNNEFLSQKFICQGVTSSQPIYEKGNLNNIQNDLEINNGDLTNKDKLDDSKSEAEFIKKQKEKLSKFEQELGNSLNYAFNKQKTIAEELDAQTKTIGTLSTSINNLNTKLSDAEQKWQVELKTLLGSNDKWLNLKHPLRIFIQKWNDVINEYNAKKQNAIKLIEQNYQLLLKDQTNWKPHNWIWLQSSYDENSVVAKNFKTEIENLKKTYQERDVKLNELLKDQEVLGELTRIRDSYLMPIKKEVESLSEQIKESQNEIFNNLEQKLSEIKLETMNIRNTVRDKKENAVIGGLLQIKHGVNLYQPQTPEQSWINNKTDFWYTKEPGQTTRQLFNKAEVINKVNEAVINLIKSKDTDFNLNPNNDKIITKDLLNLSNADNQEHTITSNPTKFGSGDYEYEITITTTYKINSSTKKIEKLDFNVYAINETILRNNEEYNNVIQSADNVFRKVNEYTDKTWNLIDQIDGDNGLVKKLENSKSQLNTKISEQIQETDLTKYVTYNLSKDVISKIDNDIQSINFISSSKKLNWWVILIIILVLILLLILLILLFLFISKNNYKYRYTV